MKRKAQPKKPGVLSVILATVASCIFTVLIYAGLILLVEFLDPAASSEDKETKLVLLIFTLFVLAPGIVAAAIVGFMLRKNK